MKPINFWAAVDRLAKTDVEKAKALGISERTLRGWKQRLPIQLERIIAMPDVAEALAQDARAGCACHQPADLAS